LTDRPSSDLGPLRDAFEDFGREDPMYAALSRSGCDRNRWDPDAFFERGRQEIDELFVYLGGLGLDVGHERALDFGCGVGRLTQALAPRFADVVGVDIASSMIEGAKRYNRFGERVRYLVNVSGDLGFAGDATFDLVYTTKVLQHVPPELQAGYLREFLRILRPGGVAVFQTRNGPRIEPGSLRGWLYRLNRTHLRRLLQRLKRQAPYEMHFISESYVEELVAKSSGRMIDVVDLSRGRGRSLRYCVQRV
jgi:2-polyprenyl-3-methyl-5-hydroxy-6-metoxy-1,4-benzoquinol methylase